MRSRYLFRVAALLAVAALGIFVMSRIQTRQDSLERSFREVLKMNRHDFAIIRMPDGHLRAAVKAPGETDEAFASRVVRLASHQEGDGDFICSVLDGCQPGGYSIELCTYCPEGRDDPACIARHANQKAIFCAQAHCAQGCD